MTGPIIPAEQWPEGAVALVWDQHGRGKALVRDEPWKSWFLVYVSIPMPDGWDWRVPVMRNQPAPAIELEQFRNAVEAEYQIVCASHNTGLTHTAVLISAVKKRKRLLALIDGQPSKGEGVSDLSGYLSAASQVRRGYDVECSHCGGFCDDGQGPCEQASKGEGVAGG